MSQAPKIFDQTQKSGKWIYPCIAGGLMLGLSVPSFSFLPLGFLAWAWCVPLLFELKRTDNFSDFLKRILITVGIGFSLITIWVVNASAWGFAASAAIGIFVWSMPFVLFYFVRKFLSRNWSLISLPPIWTAWEWIYHSTEFSFGAVRQGYLQADLLWLIQFADITSVSGVTFWLISLNVSIFSLFEKLAESAEITRNINRQKLLSAAPEAVFILLLFVLPLAYSAFVFLQSQRDEEEISILAVQPNVSPFAENTPRQMSDIFGKQLALTDKAVKAETPDLIVWHEGAIPYILSDNQAVKTYFAKQIKKWNAPVLSGLTEVRDYAENEPRPRLLEAQNRRREFFNAATVFQPAEIKNQNVPLDLSAMYKKRRLMPFLERVPLSDKFPFIADLIIPIGTRPVLSPGEEVKTLSFQAKNGGRVNVGATICYENLYPEMSAEAVRKGGAQILAAITNEGFFAGSQGQYQLAAFSRFRSIETRRAMIRAGATGMTGTIDKFGRFTTQVPMWSEQILQTKVSLSDERTFYVRLGDWLPKLCLLAVALLFLLIFSRIVRRSNGTSFFSKSTTAPKNRFNNFSVATLYKTNIRREK